MYHTPISAHGFNHQSFYRQPVSNLRQINDLISNRENKTQRIQDGILYGQFPSEYENFENQNYASTNGSNGISFNNYVNGLSKLPPIPNTPYQSMRRKGFYLVLFALLCIPFQSLDLPMHLRGSIKIDRWFDNRVKEQCVKIKMVHLKRQDR